MSVNRTLCVRRALSLTLAAASLCLLGVSEASAETISVKTTAEFVAAVAKANTNGQENTIVVAGAVDYVPIKTLTFTNKSGPLTIEAKPVSGPSVRGETAEISGSSVEPFPSQLFIVEKGVSVTLKNVQISVAGGNGVAAIEVFGSLAVESSAIVGNSGDGALVQPEATLTVHNSTISDGAEFGVVNDGTTSLSSATVAYNKDGGLENKGTLNLTNTIVAENSGEGDCVGAATTSDHSLDSNGSCGVALSKKEPLLQKSLLNDGGPTPVHSLKPGSPAIGAGAACPATDQRGATRSNPCSIGADEYSSTPPTIKVPAAPIKKEAEILENGEEGAEIASLEVTATGVNDIVRTITCIPFEPGSVFPVGMTKETCTATDGHENKASGEFEVEVAKKGVAPVAPSVVTKAASPIGETSATLNATVNPSGSEVTECEFEYGTSTAYGKTAPCSSPPGSGSSDVPVSAALSGLSASTTYDFRISAKNAGGVSKGTNESFKTSAGGTAPPTPEAAIRELLQEVGAAGIRRGIRNELSGLLEDALRNLRGNRGFGVGPGGFRGYAALASPLWAFTETSYCGNTTRQAFNDLEQFIAVITRDQSRRRPQLPSGLASAWSQAAGSIAASLSSGSGGEHGHHGW